jgi:hypothetical protein
MIFIFNPLAIRILMFLGFFIDAMRHQSRDIESGAPAISKDAEPQGQKQKLDSPF